MSRWDDYFREQKTAPDDNQGSFDWEDEPIDGVEGETKEQREYRLEREFDVFHARYPGLYDRIMLSVEIAWGRRFPHYGIAACVENARWEWDMDPDPRDGEDGRPKEPFKISNNHRAYYARLIMKNNPYLEGFFRIKRLRSRDGEL